MQYSENNIEDWDFTHCGYDDPAYDVEADLFFGTHFTTVVAVDGIRVAIMNALVDKGVAVAEENRRHVRLSPEGDAALKSWKSAASRWSRGRRFERKVVDALRRENGKNGRLRLTILPPLPGLRALTSDSASVREVATNIEVRDKAVNNILAAAGGHEPLVATVQEHIAKSGVELGTDEAMMMIEGWHQYGVVRGMSIGEYLDEAIQDLNQDDID